MSSRLAFKPTEQTSAEPVALIETQGLTVHYANRCALRDVTLSIAQGKVTAIVGPSGSGKSTFLSCLNRLTDLIPNCRVTGDVRLGGQGILGPWCDVLALRRRVGMIFQKPNPFPLSIRRNLALPLKEHGVRGRAVMEQIIEASLRDVGLWAEVSDRLDKPAHTLSGGQQQRLCIARALSLRPEVILFDEPCSALDPISAGVIEDLIQTLHDRYTVVVVTHNLPQAKRIADFTAVFWLQHDAGRLIEAGTTQQIFDNPKQRLTADYVNGNRG